jgi:hypothetical protein
MKTLLDEIVAELARARAKFPGDNVTTLALVEEVGELAKATFSEPRAAVRKEAVQVATMAMRVVLDGDSTLDAWRSAQGLDALVEPAAAVVPVKAALRWLATHELWRDTYPDGPDLSLTAIVPPPELVRAARAALRITADDLGYAATLIVAGASSGSQGEKKDRNTLD